VADQASEACSFDTLSSYERKRTPSPDSKEPSVAAAEVLPDSICQVCLNLGQQVWDPKYRVEHRLSWMPRHLDDVSNVSRTVDQGCSGCKIILWILQLYMTYLEKRGNVVSLAFGLGYCAFTGGHLLRQLNFYKGCVPTVETPLVIVVKTTSCESMNSSINPLKSTLDLRPTPSSICSTY